MDAIQLKIPGAKSTNEYIEVVEPYNGNLITKVETADMSVADLALQNAEQLFNDRSKWLSLEERLTILEKTIEIMKKNMADISLQAAREGGKPLVDSKIEVIRAIDGIRVCIDTMRTQTGSVIPMDVNASSKNKTAFTKHEPLGIVVAVSAFNHPMNLIIHQVAPAVATGCPVIIKPAEDTPLSCFRFYEILKEAGLPEGWVQPLVVKDVAVATSLVTDPRVALFTFIGSARVGWMLRSKLAAGTHCVLEHGGAAPVLVTEDVDIEEILPPLVKGGLYHAGQVCVSVQRIYAHESIARKLAERLAEEAAKLKIGDPTLATTDIGPLIRPAEVDRVESWVDEARSLGTEILTGGKRVNDYCFQNTVLFDPPAKAKVSSREIFGPVINVYPYTNIKDAIDKSNALPFSFQAAIFTKDIDVAMTAASQLNAKTVMINEHTAFRVDWMPFGGLKTSGLGIGGIPYTIKDMQNEKMIVIKTKDPF